MQSVDIATKKGGVLNAADSLWNFMTKGRGRRKARRTRNEARRRAGGESAKKLQDQVDERRKRNSKNNKGKRCRTPSLKREPLPFAEQSRERAACEKRSRDGGSTTKKRRHREGDKKRHVVGRGKAKRRLLRSRFPAHPTKREGRQKKKNHVTLGAGALLSTERKTWGYAGTGVPESNSGQDVATGSIRKNM